MAKLLLEQINAINDYIESRGKCIDERITENWDSDMDISILIQNLDAIQEDFRKALDRAAVDVMDELLRDIRDSYQPTHKFVFEYPSRGKNANRGEHLVVANTQELTAEEVIADYNLSESTSASERLRMRRAIESLWMEGEISDETKEGLLEKYGYKSSINHAPNGDCLDPFWGS